MAASVVASVALPISNNFSFAPSMDAYGKLSEYGKLGAWSPLSLFASGEQGVWYDPSDLSTMFQDAAGTIPVTADGQPVGLILDKSKGLVLGSELSANPGPFTETTGYIPDGSTLTVSGGIITSTISNGFASIIYEVSGLTVGKTYELEAIIVGSTGSGCESVSYSAASWDSPIFGAKTIAVGESGSFKHRRVATTTSMRFRVKSLLYTGNSLSCSKFSIKELPGNHGKQSTAAARPAYKATPSRIDYDVVDDTLVVTFAASLGTDCTVCRAVPGVGANILTAQTIGTSYTDSADNCGLIIIDRALTAGETADVTAYLNAKAGV